MQSGRNYSEKKDHETELDRTRQGKPVVVRDDQDDQNYRLEERPALEKRNGSILPAAMRGEKGGSSIELVGGRERWEKLEPKEETGKGGEWNRIWERMRGLVVKEGIERINVIKWSPFTSV